MKSSVFTIVLCSVAAAQSGGQNGRTSSLPSAPGKTLTWRGTLVDAGCRDRSVANLRRPAQLNPAVPPDNASADAADAPAGAAAKNGAVSAKGVSVDEKTAQAERSDALKTHTPDRLSRQMDPSCAVTGRTSSFALLLDNGTLLNLDAGGNTQAAQLIQSSPQGMAMLNGKAPGQKPRTVVKGGRQGDELHVNSIRFQ